MTAIRETFEETGLLLASPTTSESKGYRRLNDEAVLDAMRASIHAGKMHFDDFLKQYGLVANLEALLPFTEWIASLGPPRCVCYTNKQSIAPPVASPLTVSRPHSRFHTRFYITFLSSSSSSSDLGAATSDSDSSSQHHRLLLPTPDSGPRQEVIETRFVHPQDALAEHRAKQIALMPPQHYILSTLADILVGRSATLQQRERVNRLSAGAFGRMVVHPRAGKKDASGRIPLVYEGDEERGGPKGRRHRSLVLFSPESKVRDTMRCALIDAETGAKNT
jgi:8-oxo-dGTP pyrophosphatase MutT (NUDIX family)